MEGNEEIEPEFQLGKGFNLIKDLEFERNPIITRFVNGEILDKPINELLYSKYYTNISS